MAWETKRIKDVIQLKARIGWKGLRSDEFQTKSYAYLVTGQDFDRAEIIWKDCYQIDKERYEEDPYIQLNNGDVLVTKDGTIGKVAMVNGLDKPACLNSGVFVLKQKKEVFKQKYLFWELSSNIFKEFIKKNSDGSTIQHLYQNVFDFMNLLIPPLETQQKIADYLDVKTQNIDRRIELLQKKKEHYITLCKAIINEAVSSDGKTWKQLRVKDLFTIYNGNGFDVKYQGKENGDYPFCKASDINGKEKYINSAANFVNEDLVISEKYTVIPKESILFSKIGEALKKNHRKINSVPCIVDNNCAALVSKRKINIEFYYYVFSMVNMCKFDNGGPVPSVNSTQLLTSSIVYPEIQIQNQIAVYLDEKTSTIDLIVKEITTEIDKLKTYRRALINEAVTGKLNIQ